MTFDFLAIQTAARNWRQWLVREWRSARLAERLAVAVAITLPLERVPTLEVAGFTVRLSMIFGIGLIMCWLRSWTWSQWRTTRHPLEVTLIAFAAWYGIRLIGAADIRAGLQVVLPTMYVILLALSLRHSVRVAKVPLVMAAVIIGAIGASLFGLYQFIGDFAGLPHWLTAMRPEYEWQRFGFPRVLSTALEPLFFSAYLLLPLSLVLWLAGTRQATGQRGLLWLVAALLVGVDILTVSRGGLLALALLVLSSTIFIAMSGQQRAARQYLKRLVVAGIVAIILGVGMLALFNRPGQDSDVTYQSRGVTTFIRHLLNTRISPNQDNVQNEDSVAARSSARSYAVQVITASPKNILFGVGPGQYQSYNARTAQRPDIVVANVLPLDIMLHVGVIGIGLLAILVVQLFGRLLQAARQQRAYAGALAAYFMAIGLQSLTFPTLYITHLWVAVGCALIITAPYNLMGGQSRPDSVTASATRRRTSR